MPGSQRAKKKPNRRVTRSKLYRVQDVKVCQRRGEARPQPALLLAGDALALLKEQPKKHYDLIVSSPPYNIGKGYERSANRTFEEYLVWQDEIIGALVDTLKDSGSICWQVGSYIEAGELFPLDIHLYKSFKARGMRLRNRIIWTFNFGLNSERRLSGRYETVLWFTKSDNYKFNLDPIRIPQLYPGKRHPKSRKAGGGMPSGNPLGKNPGDFWEFSATAEFKHNPIWEIPNVKANHPEKTIHPCQFPIELVERCVLAFTNEGDRVLDPFVGTGTTVLAALKHARNAVGFDKDRGFLRLAGQRIQQLREGTLKARPIGKPVTRPNPTNQVARVPVEWTRK
jgi:DNA modification methylase